MDEDIKGEIDSPRDHSNQEQLDSRQTTKGESENEVGETNVRPLRWERYAVAQMREAVATDHQGKDDDFPITDAGYAIPDLDDTDKTIESLFHKWTNMGHVVSSQLRI